MEENVSLERAETSSIGRRGAEISSRGWRLRGLELGQEGGKRKQVVSAREKTWFFRGAGSLAVDPWGRQTRAMTSGGGERATERVLLSFLFFFLLFGLLVGQGPGLCAFFYPCLFARCPVFSFLPKPSREWLALSRVAEAESRARTPSGMFLSALCQPCGPKVGKKNASIDDSGLVAQCRSKTNREETKKKRRAGYQPAAFCPSGSTPLFALCGTNSSGSRSPDPCVERGGCDGLPGWWW